MDNSNPEEPEKLEVNSQVIQTITCRCGKEVDARRNHCIYCGRPLYRICFCGKRIPRTLSFCPHCGMRWDRERKVKVRRKRLPMRERLKILSRCVGFGLIMGGCIGIVLETIRLVILNFLSPSAHSAVSSLSSSQGLSGGSSSTSPSFIDIIAREIYNFMITFLMLSKRFINFEFFLKYPLVGISIIIGAVLGTAVAYRQFARYHRKRGHRSIASHQ